MRITDLLRENGIELCGKAANKQEAVEQMVALMGKTGCVSDLETYKKAVFRREEEGTTGIGEGVAIPHAKTGAVKTPGLAAMVLPNGVDYDSLDGEPAYLIFLIAAPDTEENIHLDVLGRLSVLLMDDDFRKNLIHAKSVREFLSLIDAAEAEKFDEPKEESPKPAGSYRVLAVTACPTGIAHTYMAAESLEKTAQEMGISIKVETDGSGGAKNVLTDGEIASCECIIVAADKNVPMARFNGRPVIVTKVANGINKARELLEEATSGRVPPYHTDEKNEASAYGGEQESFGRQIYKHLMNGVSHMLPFVIGGGILIALAFLFDSILAPNGDPNNFGMNSPLAAFLKTVGGTAFNFMLPILAGFIALSIGDRPALAVGFVGGAIAVAGGSGFLGALLAGFIAGYLIAGMRRLFDKLPASMEGLKPILLYQVFGILIMGAVCTYLINPPVSALNLWMSNSLENMGQASGLLLGAVLAGMMAVDMGGPFNKAAYVFGTASLLDAAGNSVTSPVMAAVMIGGMVPPIAIALCTTFFKSRFTAKERQSGLTNYIMGLSFITEGAIPFAASDPLRVIPACAAGSAVAGGLSMLFGCALPAPHGGIFVFAVVENWPMYLLSLAIGAAIGCLLLAVLKKPLPAQG